MNIVNCGGPLSLAMFLILFMMIVALSLFTFMFLNPKSGKKQASNQSVFEMQLSETSENQDTQSFEGEAGNERQKASTKNKSSTELKITSSLARTFLFVGGSSTIALMFSGFAVTQICGIITSQIDTPTPPPIVETAAPTPIATSLTPSFTPTLTTTVTASPSATFATTTPTFCAVQAVRPYTPIYIGPDRDPRLSMPLNVLFEVKGQHRDANGQLWYRLNLPDAHPAEADRFWVQVLASDVLTLGNCDGVPEVPTPVVMTLAVPTSPPTPEPVIVPTPANAPQVGPDGAAPPPAQPQDQSASQPSVGPDQPLPPVIPEATPQPAAGDWMCDPNRGCTAESCRQYLQMLDDQFVSEGKNAYLVSKIGTSLDSCLNWTPVSLSLNTCTCLWTR